MTSRLNPEAQAMLDAVLAVVEEQANDDGLWFQAETCAEAYLQQALRRLHAVIEGRSPEDCAAAIWRAAEETEELRAALMAQIDVNRQLMERLGFSEQDISDCTSQGRRALEPQP